MIKSSPLVSLSKLDEARFGVRTAKASNLTQDLLPEITDFCDDHHVELLIARCSTKDLQAAQIMENHGFRLMDPLVYYSIDLRNTPIPLDIGEVPVRTIRHGEAVDVASIAADSFRGYFGHYHADARLDNKLCDEVYADWAYRSCESKDVASEVLVAELDGKVSAFITLRHNSEDVGESVLSGVASWAQRRGIYRSLKIHAVRWFFDRGATSLVTSTQIINIPVQRVWSRLGFEMSHSYYTFHKWFTR